MSKITQKWQQHPKNDSQKSENKSSGHCYRCGYKNHSALDCKYKSATCNKCNKVGHLVNVSKTKSKATKPNDCEKKSVKAISKDEIEEDSDRDMFQVNTLANAKNKLLLRSRLIILQLKWK